MKRLLLPLVAALALPTAVSAESVWLILTQGKTGGGYSMHSLEMKDISQCEEQGQLFLTSTKIKVGKGLRGYECLTGK